MYRFFTVIICLTLILSGCSSDITADFHNKTTDIFIQDEIDSEVSFNESSTYSINKSKNKNIIWTSEFTMNVPDFWTGKFNFDLNPKGDQLNIRFNTKLGENEGLLFSVFIIPVVEKDEIESCLDFGIEPIGLLQTSYSEDYFLGLCYASEMACSEDEEELFFMFIDSIPDVVSTITPVEGNNILEWSNDYLYSDLNLEVVPISSNIINSTFVSYQNRTGATFFDKSNSGTIDLFYLNNFQNIKYYYGSNETFLAVRDEKISLITYHCSDITGNNTSILRDVINKLNAYELFYVIPEVIQIKNGNNTQNFFYWKIQNGYIGFIILNGSDPLKAFDYCAYSVYFFDDISLLNIV